jgi:hypothetical protein
VSEVVIRWLAKRLRDASGTMVLTHQVTEWADWLLDWLLAHHQLPSAPPPPPPPPPEKSDEDELESDDDENDVSV